MLGLRRMQRSLALAAVAVAMLTACKSARKPARDDAGSAAAANDPGAQAARFDTQCVAGDLAS